MLSFVTVQYSYISQHGERRVKSGVECLFIVVYYTMLHFCLFKFVCDLTSLCICVYTVYRFVFISL